MTTEVITFLCKSSPILVDAREFCRFRQNCLLKSSNKFIAETYSLQSVVCRFGILVFEIFALILVLFKNQF